MARIDWYIEGVEVSNCNCDCACPCQFESSRPTYGDCRGFAAVRIDKGHFGDVAGGSDSARSLAPGSERSGVFRDSMMLGRSDRLRSSSFGEDRPYGYRS